MNVPNRDLRRRGKTDYSSVFDETLTAGPTRSSWTITNTDAQQRQNDNSRHRNNNNNAAGEEQPSFSSSSRLKSRTNYLNKHYDHFDHRTDYEDGDKDRNGTIISWVITKWAILRMIGMTYMVAFLCAYKQNHGLIGRDGLHPAAQYFEEAIRPQYSTSMWKGFQNHPSIFWFLQPITDERLDTLYIVGMILSALVTLGEDSITIMLVLWLLYFTIITTAQSTSTFYSYGWESQLLETGFLGIFLCDNFKRHVKKPPSPIILWLFRWLCFRISMGAGLIKIRGDSCWTNKTCLYYHFETQPIPSPTSFIFHFLPKLALKHAVDLDLFVQVYTSVFVLLPTSVPFSKTLSKFLINIVRLGGFIQVGFMINIILSGNFAFLNHLTIIPALACLDDACWPSLVKFVATSIPLSNLPIEQKQYPWLRSRNKLRLFIDLSYFGIVFHLSQPVIVNLLQLDGRRQAMNTSYDKFHLVNTVRCQNLRVKMKSFRYLFELSHSSSRLFRFATNCQYGAFGSVGKERFEPIVSISYDGEHWTEIEFPCKPGKVNRRPCFCAPYHYRLDWNIWFVGFKPHRRMLEQREFWLLGLITKILNRNVKSRPWLDLLDVQTATWLRDNYEQHYSIPRYAKVDMYHYQMAAPLWEILPNYLFHSNDEVIWWNRTFAEILIPIMEFDHVNDRLVRAEKSSK